MLHNNLVFGVILYSEFDGIFLDYSRQCATLDTLDKLFKLAEVVPTLFSPFFFNLVWFLKSSNLFFLVQMQAARLKQKINSMFSGERVSRSLILPIHMISKLIQIERTFLVKLVYLT